MSYSARGGSGYRGRSKRSFTSNYKGYKISVEKKDGRFHARSPNISHQLLGYGKTQAEAIEEAKQSIDLIDKTPKITLVQNSFGHLHIFKGKPEINFRNRRNITEVDGKESGMYLQSQADIEEMYAYLTKDQKEQLLNGYPITIKDNGPFF